MQNQIPKSWQKYKLQELAEVVTRGFQPSYSEEGLRVVNQKCIRDGKVDLSESRFNNLVKKSVSKEKYLQPLDILINSTGTGTVGRVGQILELNSDLSFDSHVTLVRPDKEIIDGKFLGYKLRQIETYFERLAEGSTNQVELSRELVRNIEFLVPPLSDQNKISNVLASLDEKIENNNKIAKTLEEMAQVIFKEWFVNFHFPGYKKVKFTGDGDRKIPQDWDLESVKNLVKRVPIGKRYNSNNVKETGSVPVLDQGKSGVIGYHNNSPDIAASEQDPVIVFANHTCYQSLIMSPFSAIQNVIPYYPSEQYDRDIYWLYIATRDLVKFNDYKGHWPEFSAKRIIVPPKTLSKQYGEIVRPIFIKSHKIDIENQRLASLRDLLLPKLMKGEMQI